MYPVHEQSFQQQRQRRYRLLRVGLLLTIGVAGTIGVVGVALQYMPKRKSTKSPGSSNPTPSKTKSPVDPVEPTDQGISSWGIVAKLFYWLFITGLFVLSVVGLVTALVYNMERKFPDNATHLKNFYYKAKKLIREGKKLDEKQLKSLKKLYDLGMNELEASDFSPEKKEAGQKEFEKLHEEVQGLK